MLNSMASRTRRVRTIGVRLDEAEWAIVEARRNEDEHESISDVIRRLIAESAPAVTLKHMSTTVQLSAGEVAALKAAVSPTIRRFLATFSPADSRERRDARARRYTEVLTGPGVQMSAQGNGPIDGALVKAVDVTHLAQCCQEVMEHPPRDPSQAWPRVLQKLAETYTDTKAARLETATDE